MLVMFNSHAHGINLIAASQLYLYCLDCALLILTMQ